jgi:hypothetical protein
VIDKKIVAMLKIACVLNFNASVIFLIVATVLSAIGNSLFFEDQTDLYGPMAGNLRLMLIYLCITIITIYIYCHTKKQYLGILMIGIFLLIMMLGLEVYDVLNQVPVDANYGLVFLYLGISHLSYAGIKLMKTD